MSKFKNANEDDKVIISGITYNVLENNKQHEKLHLYDGPENFIYSYHELDYLGAKLWTDRTKNNASNSVDDKSSILELLKSIEGVEVIDNNDGSFRVNLKTKATIQDNRYSARIKL